MQQDQRQKTLQEAIERIKKAQEAAKKAAEEVQKERERKTSYPR
jgi:predicted RNase H-like HicB family nuclease